MNGTLGKLVPTAALIAILAYLSWPYFDPPVPPPASAGKLPEIAAAALRPTAPDATDRDPFGDSVRFEMGQVTDKKTGRVTRANVAASAESGDHARVTKPNTPGKTSPATTTTTATRPGIAAPTATAAKTASSNPPAEGNLVLNATLLHGQQRLAFINGRAYRPGERLEASSSDTPFMVAEIHHHRVVLEREGKLVDLNYPDKAAPAKTPLAKTAGRGGPNGPSGTRGVPGARPAANTRPGQAR